MMGPLSLALQGLQRTRAQQGTLDGRDALQALGSWSNLVDLLPKGTHPAIDGSEELHNGLRKPLSYDELVKFVGTTAELQQR